MSHLDLHSERLHGAIAVMSSSDLGHPGRPTTPALTATVGPNDRDPIDKSDNICGGMDGKKTATVDGTSHGWQMGSAMERLDFKLDGQVSWSKHLYWNLAHVQMLATHVCIDIGAKKCVLFSLSLILITAHPARRTE